jgi:DNA-binding NarL/FixJ family response regulator
MKFLVVDDHELIREAMRGALKQIDGDAAILEAAETREAMRLIEGHADLDLILLDLNLPGRDGFSVLVELRSTHPSIAVVVMSAQQDHDSVVKALNLGALGFIPKSAPRKVILSALQLVISGGLYIPPQALSQDPSQFSLKPKPPVHLSIEQPTAAPSDLGLTERQVDVLALMMQGKSNKAICRVLDLTEPTVKSHVSAILKALKVSNRTEAVIAVSELKWKLPPLPNSQS